MAIEIVQDGKRYRVTVLHLEEAADDTWTAEVRTLSADGTPANEAPAVLTDGANEWSGTVYGLNVDGPGACSFDFRAGAGRLAAVVPHVYHAGTIKAGAVLSDLCAAAGEVAPDTAYESDLPAWRVHGGPLRGELDALARAASSGAWRVLPDGRVSLAPPAWTEAAAPGPRTSAGASWLEYSATALVPFAGTTVDGRRAGRVSYDLLDGRLRVILWEHLARPDHYRRTVVGAKVVTQNGNRVDVITDDGVGMTYLPLWLGIPGASVKTTTGTRVLVIDLGGDPRYTFATLAPMGEPAAVDTYLPGNVYAGKGTERVICEGDTVKVDGAGPLAALGKISILVGHGTPPAPSDLRG